MFHDLSRGERPVLSFAERGDVVVDLRYATPQLTYPRSSEVIDLDREAVNGSTHAEPGRGGSGSNGSGVNGSGVNGSGSNGGDAGGPRPRRTRPLRATT